MAANIPQMVANNNMMLMQQQHQQQQAQQGHPQQQQQNKQLNQLVYSHLIQAPAAPMNSWQSAVSAGDRFSKAINLVSNTILAYPGNDWQEVCSSAMDLERKQFLSAPDKQSYDHAMTQKTMEMVKKRQGHVSDLQAQLTNDAARQAQLQAAQQRQQQMMLNHLAARGGMAKPGPHGFPAGMQNQIPVSGMPQQPQSVIGVGAPGLMQNRPDPRGFPMGVGRPPGPQPGFPADPLSRLSPQDQARVNELAVNMMARANEQQLNQIRAGMMQRLTPAQRAEYTNQRKDPAILYYQNAALRELQNRAAAAAAASMRNMMPQRQGGMPGAGVPPGQMNPAALLGGLGQQPGIPDGQTFVTNMESIRNEQQMAQMAQKSGQVVVPASIAPGRNATPGPMAGHPQQGNQQGPNQTPRAPQGQQPFGMPQVQMDPAATQAQTQPGVRAVGGRPMPGQPGAMNTPNVPPQASLSPAMNTLTAPMRQPPVSMGQGNPPMTATLNPQFNHQNNTRPPSMPGNMNSHAAMAGMMANLSPEARASMVNAMQQQQQQQDTNSMREFYAKLSMQGLKPGMMPGMPGQLQGGQMNGVNQAAMANANQKNPAMQGAGQPGMMMQQPTPLEREQLMAIIQTPHGRAAMNNMDIPPPVLQRLHGHIPPEVRKWAQLRQYLQTNPGAIPPAHLGNLNNYQALQFKALLDRKKQLGAQPGGPQPPTAPGPAHVPQQQGPQSQGLPPGFSYPANFGHVTRQDMETARQRNPQYQGMSDQNLVDWMRKAKVEAFTKRAWETFHATQAARANNNKNAAAAVGLQNGGMQVPQHPTGPQVGLGIKPGQQPQQQQQQQQQHPNMPMVVPHQAHQQPPKPVGAPAAETATAPPSGTMKNARPPQNPTPVQAPKGIKRPPPDDSESVASGPVSNAVQRPAPPQPEARPPSAAQKPTMEQLMRLTPDQLAKLSNEQLAKLTQEQRAYAMRNRAAPPPEMSRLRELATEGHQLWAQEMPQLVEQQVAPAELAETRAKLTRAAAGILQLRGNNITTWYKLTKDDSRARMFFKTRFKVAKHFADGETMSRLKDPPFFITKDELDQYINMIDSMLQDIGVKRPTGQDGPTATPAQATPQQAPQPSPLSAANLEKQTQALKQAQNRTVGGKAGQQPPAAPTTAQAPFHFGAQKSPAGNPEYFGEQRVTQSSLVMPHARKKTRFANGKASPPAAQQQQPQQQPTPGMPSPQVNTPSPVASRKPEPPKLTCTEPGCEMNTTGFANDEALNAHRVEEHVKPYENPLGFAQEQLAAYLGLDAQGQPKPSPTPAPMPTPAAMVASRSVQGAAAMSRGPSMQRQSSTPGGKPGPGTPQVVVADDAWAGATVDPQELFWGLGQSLEAVTGGFMTTIPADFGGYRSESTPNDTPESSKDSGASEPNSDIAGDAALDIDLTMGGMGGGSGSGGIGLDGDLLWEMDNVSMENFELPEVQAGLFGEEMEDFGAGGESWFGDGNG
ncbi:hypothetical protein C8A05DRAFT_38384, partial [Staphylotrichum tortipilum]